MLVHGREGGEIKNRSRYMFSVSSPSSTSETGGSSICCYIKDGRKISVGECALFKPAQGSPPFVAIIRSFTSDKESKIFVGVNWLYRPAEVKLLKGVALEAEPNEVFYSFHRDEIPAASLLHPCKVAFLSRGAELPPGVSSFVCRRVYDFTNKCLWWLADQDFIDERQVEVNKLLRKTHIEMHAPIKHPQGPRSLRLLNGSAATSPQKHSPDSVQNSSSNFSSQTKGKKRDRRGQSFEPNKRERNVHPDDDNSGQLRSESLLSLEVGKIAGKGGLTDSESVANLVRLLKLEKSQRQLDLTGRSILAGIVAATNKVDYLTQFVQLKGVAVFDEWLQEVHKGKIGDSGNLKYSGKSLEDFLLVMLGALDKLPVNLNALQTCNIGKSVNHLRSHKNSEIQKKARSLVDTWKKRVEAEMSINDAKSGFTEDVQWPGRSNDGSGGIGEYKHSGGSSEAVIRRPGTRYSSLKSGTVILAQGKCNLISGSACKSYTPESITSNCKDERSPISANRGISEPIQTVARKENGSCSSRSHTNNPCSSEHVKFTDAKKSTANSRTLNKTIGSDSRHRKSDVRKETASNLSSLPENVSPKATVGSVSVENIHEGDNHKLIVKIPNRVAQSIVAVAADDSSCKNSEASSPVLSERHAELDACLSEKHHSLQSSEIDDSLASQCQIPIATGRFSNGSKTAHSPVNNEMNLVKTLDSAYIPLDALIEICAMFSEANISVLPGDDVGIHLLASVATGEFSEPNIVSTVVLRPSTTAENSSNNYNGNQKMLQGIGVIQQEGLSADVGGADKFNISSGVSNVNSGESTHHRGTATENLLQERDCLGDNMILDEHVTMSCTTGRSASDICAEVLFKKCGDAKEECHNQHPAASKSVDDHLEAAEKVNSAPLNNESENTAHGDTVYPSITVDVKTNVFGDSAHSSPMEKQPHKELQSESGNADEMPVIASRASSHTVTEESIAKIEETLAGDFYDHDDEGGKRIIARGTSPSQKRKNQEENVVGCFDVTMDTDCKDEILDDKETFVQQFKISEVQICSSAAVFPEDLMSSTNGDKLVAVKGDGKDDGVDVTLIDASPTRGHPDADSKLKFDLNEGLNVDEGKHLEPVSETTDPCPNIYPASSLQNFVSSALLGHSMSVTVATAAKGPFTPPNDLLRNKKELGWKGAATTSAFRPAEPRKVTEFPLGRSGAPRPDGAACKPSHPPLNIDLNLVDESSDQESIFKPDSGCELMTTASWRSCGGLDFDLNKVDESPDMSGISSPSIRELSSRNFTNGEASCKRDFDLNNGPAEEMPVEQTSYNPSVSHISQQSASRPRYNNYDSGNVNACNPPGTSYSVSGSPSVPDREGYPFAGIGFGSHRVIGGPTSSWTFNPAAYRGSMSASSPAITLQSSLFQYPVFPFGTSNPIPTSVLAAGPSGFMDPSSTGRISAIPSQLVGNAGTVSFQYPQAYVVSRPHPDVGNIGVIETNQKRGNQGLDLNSGPGVIDLKRRDGSMVDISRQVSAINSQSFVEEQARMYSMGGVFLKRKEHDVGWNTDMLNFKQSSRRR